MHAQRHDILSNCEVNGLKLEGSSRPVSSSWGSLDSFNGTKVISKTVSKTDSNYRLMNAGQGRIYTFPGPSAKYYFYLFTNKHKKLVLTYLFFLLLKNVIELSRYHSKKYIKVNIFN